MNKRKMIIYKMCIAVILIAIGYVLPFITGGIKEIGNMLCPMHIPVLLGGIILGPIYGGVIGLIIPLFRSLTLGMPPLFPTALAMSAELLTYGVIAGIIFKVLFVKLKKNLILSTYVSLVISMILGRVIWGVTSLILYSFSSNAFTFKMFLTGAIINAWLGIIIQLVLIPLIIVALSKAMLIKDFLEIESGTSRD